MMTINRRTVIAALGLAPATTLFSRVAWADYPERPIHLIVPFAPGGNADIVGRLVGDQISIALKQPVVVENRAGAGGGLGAQLVAQAKPDGYTLLVGSNGPLTINPLVNANLGYDPLKDFVPVALTSYVPHSLLMSNKFGVKTIAELVAKSKQKPVNIATSGIGSAGHITLERFAAATGAAITHIPYQSGGNLLPDVIGGNVDGAMTEFSIAMQAHQAKNALAIGVASTKRSMLSPDVPTFIESGVKDFTAESYVGILAPAQTPAAIVDQLQKAIASRLSSGEAADKLRGLGSDIATPEQMTSQGFGAFIRTDTANMQAAAKLAGIKPQ